MNIFYFITEIIFFPIIHEDKCTKNGKVTTVTDKHAEKICTVDIHVLHVLIYFKEFLFIISR